MTAEADIDDSIKRKRFRVSLIIVVLGQTDGLCSNRANAAFCLKMVRSRPYLSMGANRSPWASNRMDISPTHHDPKAGVEKSPFQIAAIRLEIDENINTVAYVS